jgi:peptidyl-prolyl cis-trans isomerase D
MLDIFRSNTRSVLTYLFLAAIIVVFVLSFGPGSYSQGGCAAHQATFAARVNGKAITTVEWERRYRQLLEIYQRQTGGNFTEDLARQLGLPRQALDQLVERELLVGEALRRGVVVTDAELARAIQEMPAFQVNGAFSAESYKQSASVNYGSPTAFEKILREDLLLQKMYGALAHTVKVSPAEVKQAYEVEGDRVQLRLVRFPLAQAEEEVKPTPAEVAAFAAANADRIAKFHEENAARYDVPKKVRARHLLAAVPQGAPEADVDAARKKAQAALDRVRKGEDFAKVADEVTDDARTRGRGGDLGFVVEGLLDPALTSAALGLEAGELSAPVRAADGWHVVKAEEVVPAREVPLEAVKLDIARELLVKERAAKRAADLAKEALAAAKGGKALEALFPAEDGKAGKARKLGGKVLVSEETTPFNREAAFVPRLGLAKELSEAAFAAKQGDVLPKVFDLPGGPVVAVVTKREVPDPAAFEAQRASVEERLRARKEGAAREAFIGSLRAKARIEENAQLFAAQGGPGQPG